VTTGWGIGGPIPAQVARIDTLCIRESCVAGVVTRFPTLTQGAFADSQDAGSIGTGVLKRYTVTFDYPGRRLFLEPRRIRGGGHDPWDGAGMWLVGGDGGFEVTDVLAGGPADRAGIENGEVIVAVDGRDAAGLSLPELRRLLSDDRAGAVVRLRIRGEPEPRNVELTLKRLL